MSRQFQGGRVAVRWVGLQVSSLITRTVYTQSINTLEFTTRYKVPRAMVWRKEGLQYSCNTAASRLLHAAPSQSYILCILIRISLDSARRMVWGKHPRPPLPAQFFRQKYPRYPQPQHYLRCGDKSMYGPGALGPPFTKL